MRIGCLILFALAWGCASGSAYQRAMPARAIAQLPPPSATWSAELEPVTGGQGLHPELFDAVLAGLPPAYRDMLKRDRRLDAAARSIALAFGIGEDWLDSRLKRGILEYHGIVNPVMYWTRMGWRLGGENPRKLVEKDILQILRANTLRFRKGAHRIGLSVVRAGSRTWALAVVITEDMVTLAPFDRQVKPGSPRTRRERGRCYQRYRDCPPGRIALGQSARETQVLHSDPLRRTHHWGIGRRYHTDRAASSLGGNIRLRKPRPIGNQPALRSGVQI